MILNNPDPPVVLLHDEVKINIRDLVTNLFQVMREFVAKTRLVQSQVDLRWFLFYVIRSNSNSKFLFLKFLDYDDEISQLDGA